MLRFFPQFGTDPFESIDGPRFFRLAARLAAYDGVLARRLAMEQQQGGQPEPQRQTGPREVSGLPVPAGAEVVSFEELMSSVG